MEQVDKFEVTAAEWYKNVPHLPKEFTKWLADNIWWIVAIGVIVSVISLLALIPILLIAFGVSAGVTAMYSGYSTGDFGMAWFGILISLVSFVIIAVLEAVAINPLKNKAKRGWSLLFAVALVNLAFTILSSIITISIFSIIMAFVWAAVHGYFLFEIRNYFGVTVKTTAKPVVKTKKAVKA